MRMMMTRGVNNLVIDLNSENLFIDWLKVCLGPDVVRGPIRKGKESAMPVAAKIGLLGEKFSSRDRLHPC